MATRKYEQNGVEKFSTEIVLQRFRGELTMLDGRSEGGGSSSDDYGSFQGGGGQPARTTGPKQDFPMDDDIPF